MQYLKVCKELSPTTPSWKPKASRSTGRKLRHEQTQYVPRKLIKQYYSKFHKSELGFVTIRKVPLTSMAISSISIFL